MEIDSSETTPVPLPSAKPVQLAPNVILQPPLSRRGKGPALLIITPSEYTGRDAKDVKILDPEPLQKWAEEGFAVVEVKVGSGFQTFLDGCETGIAALKALPECTFEGKLGVISMSHELNEFFWLGCDNQSKGFESLKFDRFILLGVVALRVVL
jgi:carboxymethylenebutenolidase